MNFPEWITPEVFGFLDLSGSLSFLTIFRWYSMMYIVAIGLAYIQSRMILKRENYLTIDQERVDDFYFWGVLGLILGARIVSCFVYDLENTLARPWEIFLPITDYTFLPAGKFAFTLIFYLLLIGLFVFRFIKRRKLTIFKIEDSVFKNGILKKIGDKKEHKYIQNIYEKKDGFYHLKDKKSDEVFKKVSRIFERNATQYYKEKVIILSAFIAIVVGKIVLSLAFDFKYYSTHLVQILIPYEGGRFQGLSGMSVHGGAIGVTVAMFIYTRLKKIDLMEISDLVCTSIPFGYTFGRIGNFINGELYGRITASPVGMIFPHAQPLPYKLEEVKKVLTELGWKLDSATNRLVDAAGNELNNLVSFNINGDILLNLPRHPSQLYEAFLEGILLCAVIWIFRIVFKNWRRYSACIFLAGYGLARVAVEFFRQPDPQFADQAAGKYTGFIVANITMGQILSFLMIAGAAVLAVFFYFYSKNMKFKKIGEED